MISRFWQIIFNIFSFIGGFFTAKKISQAELLKEQVKQYKENKKIQNEILQRNINAVGINTNNKRLWIKNKKTNR
jgi:hypothetical protein